MSKKLFLSMSEFSSIILPCLDTAGVRNVAEFEVGDGAFSKVLADRVNTYSGSLTCIDPAPQDGFLEWLKGKDHVNHIAQPSLEFLGKATAFDAWFLDGDCNYYTVFHELREIDRIQLAAQRPLLVFLHDVSWPCARRDFYHSPGSVPPGWRHPHSFDHGVRLDGEGVHEGRGLRGMGQFAVALSAGGARNGVLTAAEDFLGLAHGEKRPFYYAHIPALFGLGVIFDARARWAEALARQLLPYHANPLLARLEEYRLRNWLEAVEQKDRSDREVD